MRQTKAPVRCSRGAHEGCWFYQCACCGRDFVSDRRVDPPLYCDSCEERQMEEEEKGAWGNPGNR